MKDTKPLSEARRLEELWAGDFGKKYIERNERPSEGRASFWRTLLQEFPVRNVLEVGCNIGANLRWIAQSVPPREIWGMDINEEALRILRGEIPGVNAVWGRALELPFRDRFFDLVFTSGVLIHQPEESLARVAAEIVRSSRRYVLCMEYYSEKGEEVFYRGVTGALFKRDYGKLYRESFRGLRLLKSGFLAKQDGWDDVTWWLFAKEGAP